MVAWQIATLGLMLIASAVLAEPRPGGPREFRVAVDAVEVLIEPSESAYPTGTLKLGDRVVVLGTEQGWATIRPPEGTFDWIDAAATRSRADGTCIVAARQARVRRGVEGARSPGPPGQPMPKGAVVRLLDHPDLTVGQGDAARTWHAIALDPADVRFVKLADLERADPPEPVAAGPVERPERLVSFDPAPGDADLPPEVRAELASIAATNRSIKSGSIETWDLAPVQSRYQSLLRQYGANPQVKAVVEGRLDQANRDHALGTKAHEMAQLLRAGDQLDGEVAQIQRSVEQSRTRTDRNYDAQGLLQPSSRRYQGQKIHALIGPEGRPITYLSIPPGVPISRYMAHRVGVRGIVHFDEGLGARLISVRDLEVIDKPK